MTPREQEALVFIRDRIDGHGIAPTYSEIAEHLSTGKGYAHRLVEGLIAAGLVKRTPNRARGLALDRPNLSAVSTELLRAELARRGVTLDALESGQRRALAKCAVSCAADCCQYEVKVGQLFCRPHWFALPFWMREKITRTFGARDAEGYQQAVAEARDAIDRRLYRDPFGERG